MKYAAEAARQIAHLLDHYEAKGRSEASAALGEAMRLAEHRITQRPRSGLAAPRPYPALASAGGLWVQSGRYWFRYTLGPPVAILNVFYDAADIPGRHVEFAPPPDG